MMYKPNIKPTLRALATALLCTAALASGARQKEQPNSAKTGNEVTKKVFKGVWYLKSEALFDESTLTIDFYGLNKMATANCDGDKITATCYGVVFLDAPPGYVDDYCTISHASLKGDVAEIKFISRRDCGGYKATLTHDPETGQITVSNVALTNAGWSKSPQSMLQNGMVFLTKKQEK